jgi:O-antigen ligase
MEIKIVSKVLLSFYFILIFIFPLTDVLDIDTWRLLGYSTINTLSLIYIVISKPLNEIFQTIYKSKISITIILLTIWAFGSYFYALNQGEVIMRSFYFVNFLITFLVLFTFVKFNNFSPFQIAVFLMINVIALSSYSYYALYQITRFADYNFGFNNLLMGFFPNRNITQVIYLIHLPFIIYIMSTTKSNLLKITSAFVSIMIVNIVFLMGARTSYVIFIILSLLLIYFLIFYKDEIRLYSKNFLLCLLGGFLISTVILGPTNDAFISNRIQTIDFEETSTNTRLRYYKVGFEQVIKNPLIGVGFGNWKIISIDLDKANIVSYIIPYTMHNDFLEIASELGILGLILFLYIFYSSYRNSWHLFNRVKSNPLVLIIPLSLLIYIIDSNINFPFTRSGQLFFLALLLMLSEYFKNYNDEKAN